MKATHVIKKNPELPAGSMANVWAGFLVHIVRRIGFDNVQVQLGTGLVVTVNKSDLIKIN